jgi:hypothetical protein
MIAPQQTIQPSTATSTPEVTLDWLHDNQIAIFSITNVTRPAVDTYCDLIKQTMENWSRNRVYLALYDHSAPGVHMTPYIRQRIRELTPLYPDLKGFAAIVAANPLIPLAQLMIRLAPAKLRQGGLFRTRAEGLRWLESKLPLH